MDTATTSNPSDPTLPWDHVIDRINALRRALLWVVVALVLGTGVGWGVADRVFGPRTSVSDRARMLRRIHDVLERRKDEFRELLVSAHAAEYMTHGVQLDTAIEQIHNYADLVQRFEFEELLPPVSALTAAGTKLVNASAFHQPVGVCGLIPTWNFPLYVTAQKIGPALAMGCTMVIKPSPWGPLIDLLLAEVIEECEVPAGVYNVHSRQVKTWMKLSPVQVRCWRMSALRSATTRSCWELEELKAFSPQIGRFLFYVNELV